MILFACTAAKRFYNSPFCVLLNEEVLSFNFISSMFPIWIVEWETVLHSFLDCFSELAWLKNYMNQADRWFCLRGGRHELFSVRLCPLIPPKLWSTRIDSIYSWWVAIIQQESSFLHLSTFVTQRGGFWLKLSSNLLTTSGNRDILMLWGKHRGKWKSLQFPGNQS